MSICLLSLVWRKWNGFCLSWCAISSHEWPKVTNLERKFRKFFQGLERRWKSAGGPGRGLRPRLEASQETLALKLRKLTGVILMQRYHDKVSGERQNDETQHLLPRHFFADTNLTQGICIWRFGPNSRIFALAQGKFEFTQVKMVKIG